MTATGEEGAEKARRISAGIFKQLIAEEHRLRLQLRNVQQRIIRFAMMTEAGYDDGDTETQNMKNEQQQTPRKNTEDQHG